MRVCCGISIFLILASLEAIMCVKPNFSVLLKVFVNHSEEKNEAHSVDLAVVCMRPVYIIECIQ